jgi:AcrR family transcriptional regulator
MTLEHNAVRQTLIKATLKLMEKGGLEGVKARAVAEHAGVSVGTIYNLFGSFDRLILAANLKIYDELRGVGERRMAELEAAFANHIAGGMSDTPRNRMLQRLSGLADAYVDFVDANANRWSALLAFNRTRSDGIGEDNLVQLNGLIDIVGAALTGAPAWPTARERRLAGRALWSAVHGIVTTNFFGGEEATARERTTTLLRLLLTTFVDGVFAQAAD